MVPRPLGSQYRRPGARASDVACQANSDKVRTLAQEEALESSLGHPCGSCWLALGRALSSAAQCVILARRSGPAPDWLRLEKPWVLRWGRASMEPTPPPGHPVAGALAPLVPGVPVPGVGGRWLDRKKLRRNAGRNSAADRRDPAMLAAMSEVLSRRRQLAALPSLPCRQRRLPAETLRGPERATRRRSGPTPPPGVPPELPEPEPLPGFRARRQLCWTRPTTRGGCPATLSSAAGPLRAGPAEGGDSDEPAPAAEVLAAHDGTGAQPPLAAGPRTC